MTEILANGYSSKSSHRKISNEYQHDRVYNFQRYLSSRALDESSLSIGRVKGTLAHKSLLNQLTTSFPIFSDL